jgi:predicted metal-dependent enzyme (double-stranded beta helix superfamily)
VAARYGIKQFITDAKDLLLDNLPLTQLHEALGTRLVELSERDDLTSHGRIIGPSDASFNSYLLWREPPHLALVLAQFEPGYRSPIHEHGDHWVLGAGYRGRDRWDVYERLDGSTAAGPAKIRLKDQVVVEPGSWTALQPPPASIHSHNNLTDGFTSELIFSAVAPIPRERRLLFDLEEQTCRVSWFGAAEHVAGGAYPGE